MINATRLEQQIEEIADSIKKDAHAIKHLLWEIKRMAVEKGNCKDIWKLADKALKHITSGSSKNARS